MKLKVSIKKMSKVASPGASVDERNCNVVKFDSIDLNIRALSLFKIYFL